MEADMEPPKKHPHPLWKSDFAGLSIRRIYGGTFHTYHTYDETEGGYSTEKTKLRYATVPMPTGREKVLEKL